VRPGLAVAVTIFHRFGPNFPVFPPGHISSALLVGERLTLYPLGWAGQVGLVVGCLLPDLLDKPLRWGGVFPWGRTVGHSALLWCAMSLIALIGVCGTWVRRRSNDRPEKIQAGRSPESTFTLIPLLGLLVGLSVGGCLHLLGDLVADVESAWRGSSVAVSWWFGWPWRNPDHTLWSVGPHPAGHRLLTVVEVLTVAWLVVRVSKHASARVPAASEGAR
jgi:hypothetical protein